VEFGHLLDQIAVWLLVANLSQDRNSNTKTPFAEASWASVFGSTTRHDRRQVQR
jgi:hypothetical protein